MIKIRYPLFGGRWIRYPLFGGRRNVLECNFVDLQRGVGADTVEEPRDGWALGCGAHCAERLSIAPDCLNPPPPVRSSEQLGADQSIRHWPRDQLLKTSHELGLAVQVDCCAHVGENSLAHAAPFPSVPGYRSVLPDGQPHGVDRTSDGVLAAAICSELPQSQPSRFAGRGLTWVEPTGLKP
jgi:hypothetical protein